MESRCQDIRREIQMSEQKDKNIFQTAIEGKLRVQDRASERMQDQVIEEIKESAHSRKTEKKPYRQRGKSMTCGCTKK